MSKRRTRNRHHRRPAATRSSSTGRSAPTPHLRLALRALAIWLAVFCVYALANQRVEFLNSWTAAVVARLLDLLGMNAAAAGDVVTWHNHAQSFTIIEECTGVFGFWILAAFILATPTRLGWRLLGLAAGALVIFVANQLRLLGLVLMQTYWPSAFAITHDYLWQVVFVMVIAVTFLAWLGRIDLELEAVPR